MNKLSILASVAFSAALTISGSALAGNAAAGKEKSKTCAACHGADGNSASADFPKLAGQQYDYLVKSLQGYKSGARKNPIMAGQVANLKKDDIDDLAAYFSSQQALETKY